MNDESIGTASIPDVALDRLFRTARTYDVLLPPVTDTQLRALYELVKWGPTNSNAQPLRILFLRSEAAKERLKPALSSTNRDKTMKAPVTAVLAYDLKFYEHLSRMYFKPNARSWYEGRPDVELQALRNSSIQGGYFILAARAVGLDCGPMSGFKNEVIDAEFFPEGNIKSNFLCNLGRGDASQLVPRDDRFTFDEVCKIL